MFLWPPPDFPEDDPRPEPDPLDRARTVATDGESAAVEVAALAERLLRAAAAMRPAAAKLETHEGAILASLVEQRRVRRHGYLRVADLVEQHVKAAPRTVQEMARLHCCLERVPDLRLYFEQGVLSKHQVLAVAGALEREPEALFDWIQRSLENGVRDLKRLARESLGASDAEDGDPEGREVEIAVPPIVRLEYREAVEVGRKKLGYKAPAWKVIEAALLEAGLAGAGIPREEAEKSAPAARKPRPKMDVPVSGGRLADAERTVREVQEHLRGLDELIETDMPAEIGAVIDRLRQAESLRRPLHILEGRVLNALCGLRMLERFGYRDVGELAEARLGMSARTARNRMLLADLCADHPALERALLDNEITERAARLIRSVCASAVHLPAWIDRARKVTLAQFEREILLREKLQVLDRQLVSVFHGPFPLPGLEKALWRAFAKRKWTRFAVEEALRKRGIRPTREANWRDPAENPSILARLEAMADLLLAREFDIVPDVEEMRPAYLRQPSARRRRVRVRFWAPDSVANDLDAALDTLQERLKAAGKDPPERWLAFAMLLRHAIEQWNVQDPESIPERHAIYERDRHQCQVPGCERRAELHSHHIVPLGLGGPDVEANQVCVCSAHHKLIHEGRLRVSGQAPDELRWDLGGGLLRTLGMRIVAQR